MKRFGRINNAFLSFPQPGWTLAVDLPGSNLKLLGVLDELDNELASIGGKIYLAKDLQTKTLKCLKNLSFISILEINKKEMDPDNLFKSDLSIRLKM